MFVLFNTFKIFFHKNMLGVPSSIKSQSRSRNPKWRVSIHEVMRNTPHVQSNLIWGRIQLKETLCRFLIPIEAHDSDTSCPQRTQTLQILSIIDGFYMRPEPSRACVTHVSY